MMWGFVSANRSIASRSTDQRNASIDFGRRTYRAALSLRRR
jgi:hypothetical protein